MSPGNLDHGKAHMIIGDFNSHCVTWRYSENYGNGDLVEMWAEAYHLSLIYGSKLPRSFNSSRWRGSYNPDLTFADSNIEIMCKREDERQQNGKELIEGIDMTHTNQKAWLTLHKLNNDPKKVEQHHNIIAKSGGTLVSAQQESSEQAAYNTN